MLQIFQDRLNYVSECKACEDQGGGQRTAGCSLGNEWEGSRGYIPLSARVPIRLCINILFRGLGGGE